MSVPQSIIQQLNVVDSDDDALVSAQGTASGSAAALAAATTKASNDAQAVVSAQTQLATDKQTLIDLINAQYGPDGPPSPPPPPPDTVPGGNGNDTQTFGRSGR